MTDDSKPPSATASSRGAILLNGLALAGVLAAAIVGGRWLRMRSQTEQTLAEQTIPVADSRSHSSSPTSIDRGEVLFQVHCAKCHGPEGHGEPDAMERLRPPPRDFASRPWRFDVSTDAIRQVTLEGIPATAMPAHREAISPDDLEQVVAHTLRLATAGPIAITRHSAAETMLIDASFVPLTNARPAPNLELSDAAGQTRTLADERGRVVLLHFWGTTCEHCLAGMPKLQALTDQWESQGLSVLNVCADAETAEAAQEVVERVSPRSRVWIDKTGLANSQYEVQILPTIWLIDGEGRLLGSAHGMRDWRSPAMWKMIEFLVKRSPNHSPGDL